MGAYVAKWLRNLGTVPRFWSQKLKLAKTSKTVLFHFWLERGGTPLHKYWVPRNMFQVPIHHGCIRCKMVAKSRYSTDYIGAYFYQFSKNMYDQIEILGTKGGVITLDHRAGRWNNVASFVAKIHNFHKWISSGSQLFGKVAIKYHRNWGLLGFYLEKFFFEFLNIFLNLV